MLTVEGGVGVRRTGHQIKIHNHHQDGWLGEKHQRPVVAHGIAILKIVVGGWGGVMVEQYQAR